MQNDDPRYLEQVRKFDLDEREIRKIIALNRAILYALDLDYRDSQRWGVLTRSFARLGLDQATVYRHLRVVLKRMLTRYRNTQSSTRPPKATGSQERQH